MPRATPQIKNPWRRLLPAPTSVASLSTAGGGDTSATQSSSSQTSSATVTATDSAERKSQSTDSRLNPSSVRVSTKESAAGIPVYKFYRTILGVPWVILGVPRQIATPQNGKGTLFEIGFCLDSESGWVTRTMNLPKCQINSQRAETRLPKETDQEFWAAAGQHRNEMREFLTCWIVEAFRKFTAMVAQRLDRPVAMADTEETPYTNREPGIDMPLLARHRWKNIDDVSWKVSTKGGETYEIGWRYRNEERYTTCVITLEGGLTRRDEIRERMPPYEDGRFWNTQHPLTAKELRRTHSALSTMIASLKRHYRSSV